MASDLADSGMNTAGLGVRLGQMVRTALKCAAHVWPHWMLVHWKYISRVIAVIFLLVLIVARLEQCGQLARLFFDI